MDNRADLELIATKPGPAFVLARDYPDGMVIATHAHPVGQLLHTLTGVMLAETPGCRWAIPPGRALWIPEGMNHQFQAVGAVRMRALYVAPSTERPLPQAPKLLRVSALIRELIVRAEADGKLGTSHHVQTLVVPLLLAELSGAEVEALSIPMPTSPAMLAFTRIASEKIETDINDIATRLGMSMKTLARKFASETGLSPNQWRRHFALLAAVTQIRQGRSITVVAHEAGYNSSASFAAAFKRCFGMTPSQGRHSGVHQQS